MCLINALTSFRVSQCELQHPQAVHVIWPSLLRSKAWQTRSAATPPMPLLGKLLKLQWYSRKSFAVSEKKTWKGPNICDSHLLDSSLASFLGGTMVYGNTEKVILLLPGKPHPARRLLAIFHGRHLTRTTFKSWALKQPATISYTFSNIAAHETTWSHLRLSISLVFPSALVAYIEMREERPKLHQCLKVSGSSGSSLHSRQGHCSHPRKSCKNRKNRRSRKFQLRESNTFLHFVLMGQQKKDALDAAPPLRSEANWKSSENENKKVAVLMNLACFHCIHVSHSTVAT